MSNLEKEKQAFAELDRAHMENLARANAPLNQEMAANPQFAPYEDFMRLVTQLQSTARQQQLRTEQSIQQTLQQAATALNDAQKIEQITQQMQMVQQALNQQGPTNNPEYYTQMMQQLSTNIQDQLHRSDQQVTEALQQTVASMSQSQSAMFNSQLYANMAEMLKQCDQVLQQWKNPGSNTVH